MKKKIFFYFVLLSLQHFGYGTFTFTGNAALPATFTEIVLNETYDPCTRTWYLALDDAGGGAGNFAISKIGPGQDAFTGIASHPLVNNQHINLITHEKRRGLPARFLAALDVDVDTNIIALSTDGSVVTQGAIPNDATGAPSSGVINMVAKDSQIFAIVEPTGAPAYGTPNTGVAVINVTVDTLVQDEVNAQTGAAGGNTAQFLDGVLASTPSMVIQANLLAIFPENSMFYDDILDLLYIGVAPLSSFAAGDGCRGVVVGDISSSGLLVFRSMIADALFIDGQLTNIIGITTTLGTVKVSQANHINVLHASTGSSYLVVNGGSYEIATANKSNFISALPLIDDPLTPAQHGIVADKNSALVNGKFVTAPTVNADLPAEGEPAVDVGGGPLPLTISTAFSGTAVTDLKIVGDTIYVANGETNGASDENGIFYSTALFDETGKIVRWTPWAKKAVPFDLFPALVPGTIPLAERGKVQFFEVDSTTGEVLFVDGHVDTTAGRTDWVTSDTATSLVTSVNTALTSSSTAVLDLSRSTRGFGVLAGDGRYALFGGDEQVVFTQLSESQASATGAEIIIEDFSVAANLLTTALPTDAGNVKHLEYSRRLGGTADSYFFAGTDAGLFVFADAGGAGFDVTATPPRDLSAAPFTGRTWQAAPLLDQAILDIKTSGRQLYCMTCASAPNTKPQIKVLRIPFTTNISTMFVASNIFTLAQAGVGVFEDVFFFNGMEIVATDDPLLTTADAKEQLVLATNNGIFTSRATQAAAATGIIAATDQTTAAWQRLNATDNTFFVDSFTHDTPIRHTSWYISNAAQNFIFNKGNIHQLSAAGTPGAGDPPLFPSNFNPTDFNGTRPSGPFEQITTFWSDGGRRLIAKLDSTPNHTLQGMPLDSTRRCTAAPTTLTNETLNSATGFHWIRNLHSGFLIAGTNEGIVSLQ